VIQAVLLVAVQPQHDDVLTLTLPVSLPEPWARFVGETKVEQADPSCVTVKA
jgi:hypothetical protein